MAHIIVDKIPLYWCAAPMCTERAGYHVRIVGQFEPDARVCYLHVRWAQEILEKHANVTLVKVKTQPDGSLCYCIRWAYDPAIHGAWDMEKQPHHPYCQYAEVAREAVTD